MDAEPTEPSSEPWYQCQRCGNCCRWPGDIWVNEEEIPAIAGFLGIGEDEFIRQFTRLTANR